MPDTDGERFALVDIYAWQNEFTWQLAQIRKLTEERDDYWQR